MELRLKFDGQEAGRKLKRNMDRAGQQVREAVRYAANTAADEILFRGAEDISDAGNFGEAWQDALHADIEETQRTVRVIASMQGGPPVSYWPVFEYGATIFAHNETGYMNFPIDKSGPSGWVKVPSVTIPKKFHLNEIIAQVAKELGSYYKEALR
jgi:hypothetical protein